MKRKFIFILFFAVCLTLSAREFNVRDYGAKGDGKTDDTAAVQAAADAAVKANQSQFDHRSIYFPPGRYKLNGTVTLANISLRGEDAEIIQTDHAAVTFNYTNFWSVRVTGLTFNGGKGHVAVINDNLDKSLFFVDHCRFFHCGGTALQTRHGAQSCLFTVKNCEFIRCICAIDSDSDWTVIRDNWIMNAEKMLDSAVIVNRHGVMTVDNLLGVPLCNGDNQRWIDNYGSLMAIGCRFGAEGGGFTAVYNYRKYSKLPGLPNSVIIRDCEVSAHTSNLRNCMVYCFEVPNLIAMENCRSTLTGGVLLDPKLDMKTYFQGERGSLTYRQQGNVGFRDILPSSLIEPYVQPVPHPAEHLKGDALTEKIKAYQVKTAQGTCEVNVLTQPGTELVLAGPMDGSTFRNDELLAIVRKADPACLMRRWDGNRSDAPFATLRHVKIDLDKTPWLFMDLRSDSPAEFAVKFIDEESGRLLTHRGQQRNIGRMELNLPEAMPALKGKKTLTFLIYYIGRKYIPRQGKTPHRFIYAKAGSVLEIHELGFNPEPRLPRNKAKRK